MAEDKVTVVLVTLDRTRRASVTLPRSMYVSDIIKASTKRWFLAHGTGYQVCNTSSNRVLLASDSLNAFNVKDGDVLMLQPFAAHGAL
jgi:hypothetical protein